MGRIALRTLTAAVGALGLATILLLLFESRFVYLPDPVIHRTPETVGLSYRDVRFPSGGGVVLDGWFLSAGRPQGIVIVCHGNAGNISTRIPLLVGLHDLSLSVFIFDYRGYGRSTGHPSEAGTYLDAEAAWQWVETSVPGARNGRLPVIIMGRSLGGPIAAHLASVHAPRALILDSTFPSLTDLIRDRLPVIPVYLLARYRYDTLVSLSGASYPILVVHSRDDKTVPIAEGRALYNALETRKQFLEIDGPHARGFAVDAGAYARGLRGFFRRFVSPFPAG